MKIKIQQFLFGKNHSWSVVGKNIGRALINKSHEVDFVSTDEIDEKYIPEDLKPFVKTNPDSRYDLQISYTAMHNFPTYLSNGNKNRFGIWNYEFTKMPDGMAKYYKYTDKFLPSSNFSKEIFAKNGIPGEHMVVIPHGIEIEKFKNAQPIQLKTDKKIKLLCNIAQPHMRKNLSGTLEAFGKVFNKQDDICFVIKVVDKKPDKQFEVSFGEEFFKFKKKYSNHAECLILKEYVPSLEGLYKACDILFMIPNTECYHLPSAEALCSGNVVISSRYGGQLDFLDDTNSLLVEGKLERAPRISHYWKDSPYSEWFVPDLNDAMYKLKYAVDNYEVLKKKFSSVPLKVLDWSEVVDKIIDLCV